MAAIYGKGQKITKDFFDTAEEEVLKALKGFAENAEGEDAFQKLLFAEDTARGFAFIELCRKRYDVIVMNPPFGASTEGTNNYFKLNYPKSRLDLAAVFVDRTLSLKEDCGSIGSISTRTIFFLSHYYDWRYKILNANLIGILLDLGGGVLDAMVETAAYVLTSSNDVSSFIRVTKSEDKKRDLELIMDDVNQYVKNQNYFELDVKKLKDLTNAPLCYWIDNQTLDLVRNERIFKKGERAASQGIATSDNFRFVRDFLEINPERIGESVIDSQEKGPFLGFMNTPSSVRFYYDHNQFINWSNNGCEVKSFAEKLYKQYSRTVKSEKVYFKKGLSWAFRTSKFQPHIIPIGNMPTSGRYLTLFNSDRELLYTLSLWNSEYFDYCLKLSMEKDNQPLFKNGSVNQLPHPNLSKELEDSLIEISKNQFQRVKQLFNIDECSLSFSDNGFIRAKSLYDFSRTYLEIINKNRTDYLTELLFLNDLIYSNFKIDPDSRAIIKAVVSSAGGDDEGKLFDHSIQELYAGVFSILVGCVFNRWDIRVMKFWKQVE